jgi:MSHA biogenesis protein MshO
MRTRPTPPHATARSRGFTLVELIVGMVISAILMGMIAMIMGSPVQSYLEQSKRNDLVNASERITRRMGEDLKTALPNSVRMANFASTSVLQMLAVANVVFYRNEGAIPNPPVELSFNPPGGDTFVANGTPFSQSGLWLVVKNDGAPGRDAYELVNVITRHNNLPTGGANAVSLTLEDAAFFFTNDTSPSNRMFGVSGPITYVCNRTTGILRRFSGHAIAQTLPVDESAAQLNSAGTVSTVIATGVFACNLACSFMPGTSSTCRSTVTFDVTMTRGAAPDDENLHVFQQFSVENAT